MKRKYKKGDPIYHDFEGDRVKVNKLCWCASCEQWIPPPYIHSCYSASEYRRLNRTTVPEHQTKKRNKMKLNEKVICEILERFANEHSLAKGGNFVVKIDPHSTSIAPKPGYEGFKYEDSYLLQSILDGARQLLWFFWREGYSVNKPGKKDK